jgi:hypothetical protein
MELQIRYDKTSTGNKLNPVSREILAEQFKAMLEKGGNWYIRILRSSYTPTRYKYLFGCVYLTALPNVADLLHIVEFQDGEYKTRPIETTSELHDLMKWKYAAVEVMDPTTGDVTRLPVSTTQFEDAKFYSEFEEQVILFLSEIGGFPNGCMSREEYAGLMKSKPK